MSWQTVPITKVARVVGGATPKTGNPEFWDGSINWATPKDLSGLQGKYISSTPRKITDSGLKGCAAEVLRAGSVLFSSRAPIGHIAINTVPMATNQGFKSFVPGPELDASFLYWWLDANREQLQAMGTGATFKEVSKTVVERLEIPLPPLDEQKRIAGILDQADALRRLRSQALDKLNTLGQAIFHEMFGQRELPKVSLAELVEARSSLADPTLDENAELPHVGPEHIRQGGGHIEWDRVRACRVDGVTSGKYRFEAGDVIYSKIRPYLNKVAIADRVGMCSADMYALLPKSDRIKTRYLHFILGSREFLAYGDSVSGRANIPKMNRKQLMAFEIPLPPVNLQEQFDERLRDLVAARNQQFEQNTKLHQLFASLQHRAFRGEL
ncbi:MAG: restriction endonuclease subunit S [Alphaproteobacteria bacterium]|nr:restriction endonuclease subunit S [Alphaproteobacteria bacterium]